MKQSSHNSKKRLTTNQPIISVLMAVYNNGNTDELKDSISSILEQSFSDFELIICNDGSPQEIEDYLIKWSKEDPRIIIISNDRKYGAAFSRNRCFHLSRGQYIAIMDSDDISSTDRFEKQITYLNSHPDIGFVGCNGAIFHNFTGDTNETYWHISHPEAKDFLMTLPFVHGSLLFRREAMAAVGGYSEDKRVIRSEDYEMLMRIYKVGFKGANISDTIYFIRESESTFKRRKYRYRFNEAYVKWNGFKRLGLWPSGIPYAIKPLIVGLIPRKILIRMKKAYYIKKDGNNETPQKSGCNSGQI